MDPKKCKHNKWMSYKRCRKKTIGMTASAKGRCRAMYCSECGLCLGCGQINKVTIQKPKDS